MNKGMVDYRDSFFEYNSMCFDEIEEEVERRKMFIMRLPYL
jgi:hypothetical protein